MPLINVAELINRYGIRDNSIASGNLKEIGSPLKQMTADEAAVLKGIIDEMYLQFVNVVSTGRNLNIETVKKIADGRIYTGKQALEKGLVDQLGELNAAGNVRLECCGFVWPAPAPAAERSHVYCVSQMNPNVGLKLCLEL